MEKRYLSGVLDKHLGSLRQIVFLMGPRQVGKTTLAKSLLPEVRDGENYFNWDNPSHRKILTTQIFSGKISLQRVAGQRVVFDEIHRYPRWKNSLKGLFDKNEPNTHWVVTGSSSLNVWRKGQDSLLGRHFSYHMAPLSVAEILAHETSEPKLADLLRTPFVEKSAETQVIFEKLLDWSGFPEPYFKQSKTFLQRWRNSRLDRLINQDLGSLENLRNLPLVEQLAYLLPERVGSPLSLNSLREDLEVHFATVKHWLDLLERSFYGFRVPAFHQKKTRLLKKEAKWYLWDWTELSSPGARFENLVAVHLKKYVDFLNDFGFDEVSLHYLRDRDKREIDFVICQKRKPVVGIECKLTSEAPSGIMAEFATKYGIQQLFLLTQEDRVAQIHNVRGQEVHVGPASKFLAQLV